MPTIIGAVYLSYYNPARNSDKLFNVFLTLNDNNTYSCLTENGRRGSNLVCRTVCRQVSRERAQQKFWEKVFEKRNHRETPYSTESFGTSYSQVFSQYTSDIEPENVADQTETGSVDPRKNIIDFPVQDETNQSQRSNLAGLLNSGQFDSLEF